MISKERARQILAKIHGSDRRPNLLHPLYYFVRAHQRTLERHRAAVSGTCLDIGCGDRFYETFYAGSFKTYVGIDYRPATSVFRDFQDPDLIADGGALPIATGSVDTVLLIEVLEHVSMPERLLAETCRVLKPGGRLVLTTPFAMPEHGEPYDYFRYTQYGLKFLLEQAGLRVSVIEGVTSLGGILSYFVNTFSVVGTFSQSHRFARVAKILQAPFLLLFWGVTNSLGMIWDRVVSKRGFTLNYFALAEKA